VVLDIYWGNMDIGQLLTLTEASRATGLSGGTLRRYIKEGRLVPEPRQDTKMPYWVSIQALLDAHLKLVEEPQLQVLGSSTDAPDHRRQRAELETLRAEIKALVADNGALRERAAHAEGALTMAQWAITELTKSRGGPDLASGATSHTRRSTDTGYAPFDRVV
jgi:hypothetical protein